MWADPSSAPSRQQVQASASLIGFNPLDDNASAFETRQSESLRTSRNTSFAQSPTTLSEDFDLERQFWPSSTSARTSLDSRTPLLRDNSGHRIRRTTRQNTLRNHPSSPSPQEAPVISPLQESCLCMASPRVDFSARNSLREMILSAILSEVSSPLERVALLDDCRASAEASNLGIPFRDILSEPMEPLGVSALMYELMGCQPDWDGINDAELGTGLEMVLYLIEHWSENVLAHGKMGVQMNVVRTACLRRYDEYEGNRLFQYLRPIVSEAQSGKGQLRPFEYDISVTPLGGVRGNIPCAQPSNLDFTALISIPHFASRLSQIQDAATINLGSSTSTGRKPAPPVAASMHVAIEFLAVRRAWRLKVDSNMLKLELLDGPGGSTPCITGEEFALIMDARVKVIAPEREQQGQSFGTSSASRASGNAFGFESDGPVELLLPRTLLRPIAAAGPGTTEATLSPCFCAGPYDYNSFRGLDDARLLHDGRGALLLELTVRFAHDPLTFTLVDVSSVPSHQFKSASEAGPSRSGNVYESEFEDDDDLYVTSDMDEKMGELNLGARPDESEWEEVSQIDETESAEGGWVKASWSGKDEEL